MSISIPKITVIVISYNFEKFIGDCLQSVLDQTLQPFEIIVCDDCSSDSSWEIICRYANKFPKLIIPLRQESNIGHTKNGIFGLSQVKGNLYSVIDGDDRWLPEKLSAEWAALVSMPSAKMAYSGVFITNEKNIRKQKWIFDESAKQTSGDVFLRLLAKRFFKNTRSLPRNYLIYTEVQNISHFEKFNPKVIFCDWDYALGLSYEHSVAYSGGYYVEYRMHGTGINKTHKDLLYDSARYVIIKNLSKLRECSPIDIDYTLDGMNSFLNSFPNREGLKDISISRENIFLPKIAINGLPQSGEELLLSFLNSMPGLKRSSMAINSSSAILEAGEHTACVEIGIDMPKLVPVSEVSHLVSKLNTGDCFLSYLSYADELNGILQNEDCRMMIVECDHVEWIANQINYIVSHKNHPMCYLFRAMSFKERIECSVYGVNTSNKKFRSAKDRHLSIAKWKDLSDPFVVNISDFFDETDKVLDSRVKRFVVSLADHFGIQIGEIYLEETTENLVGHLKSYRLKLRKIWKLGVSPLQIRDYIESNNIRFI